MIVSIVFISLINWSTAFDIFSDLGYEDPLINYADNWNNRISAGISQECTGNDGSFGVCRQSVHCRLSGGSSTGGRGTCTNILDTCCSVSRSCGRTTKTKVSTFVNPSIVPQDGGVCVYTIFKVNSNVCQVRVDFDTNLSEPELIAAVNGGKCLNDRIIFADGEGYQTPIICGRNTNQHLYLRMTSAVKSMRITAIFTSRVNNNVKMPIWTMKLTQLECPGINTELLNPYHRIQAAVDYPKLAPRGCLQYFIPTQGTFTSFNSNGQLNGGLFQPELEYSMCFYRPRGSCGIALNIIGRFLNPGTTILYGSELEFILGPRNSFRLLSKTSNSSNIFTVFDNHKEQGMRKGRGLITGAGRAQGNTKGPFYMKFKSSAVVDLGFEISYQVDLPCFP